MKHKWIDCVALVVLVTVLLSSRVVVAQTPQPLVVLKRALSLLCMTLVQVPIIKSQIRCL